MFGIAYCSPERGDVGADRTSLTPIRPTADIGAARAMPGLRTGPAE